jgi:hypothetical protein
MSRIDSGTVQGESSGANIYTVLVVIAVLCLAVAVGVVYSANMSLLDAPGVSSKAGSNPFYVVQKSDLPG